MPYIKKEHSGLIVESENTRTTLRIFDKEQRLFSCEITTVNPTTARVTNGSGVYTKTIHKALSSWFKENGYQFINYERTTRQLEVKL